VAQARALLPAAARAVIASAFLNLIASAAIMDNTSATTTPSTLSDLTPFPVADAAPSPKATTPDNKANAAAAAPLADGLIKRVTQSAHDAVDTVAAKVSAVADGLQGGVDQAGDTRDEWLESARDAIRQHPFAAVAGAIVIGAALLSLRSSRD
jgi:hypothetical protein